MSNVHSTDTLICTMYASCAKLKLRTLCACTHVHTVLTYVFDEVSKPAGTIRDDDEIHTSMYIPYTCS